MARSRTLWIAGGCVALAALAGWVVLQQRTPTARLHSLAETTDYLPGVAADVFLPAAGTTRAPVVVLVPGGAWRSADRTGLGPLADSLAEHGMAVVNATYRAADSGARFPVPVRDIVCAVDFAADRARRAMLTPGPIILVGHSAGAQLAALAALNTDHFRGACRYPPAVIDGFVGLAGPYDIMQWQDLAFPLFGVPAVDDPAVWRDGNPLSWVTKRTGAHPLPVLLVHGEADHDVPSGFSTSFAHRLTSAGHPVQLTIAPGADHGAIYTPGVVSAILVRWIERQSVSG